MKDGGSGLIRLLAMGETERGDALPGKFQRRTAVSHFFSSFLYLSFSVN